MIGDRPVILYGSGQGYYTLAASVLRPYKVRPSLVLDRKFIEPSEFWGIPARSPEGYTPSSAEREEAVVILTVGGSKRAAAHNTVRELGYRHVIAANEIYEYHMIAPAEQLLNEGYSYYRKNREQIESCYGALADEKSREVFRQVLATHMLRAPQRILSDPLEDQYFPPDVPGRRPHRIINCGAYDGDTIRSLKAHFGPVEAVACFEPDPGNFVKLVSYLEEERARIASEIIAVPCGVYDRDTQLRFGAGEGTNSAVSDSGGSMIQCVALDHALPTFHPTTVTMDVEGVEPQALVGSRCMISAYLPDLAICVYHAPQHLWELPLWARSISARYQLYLRNHTGEVAETVLYARTRS